MDLAGLRRELDRLGISPHRWPWPDLGNHTQHDGYGIDQQGAQWRVFERERGVIFEEKFFATEDAACQHMLTMLSELST